MIEGVWVFYVYVAGGVTFLSSIPIQEAFYGHFSKEIFLLQRSSQATKALYV